MIRSTSRRSPVGVPASVHLVASLGLGILTGVLVGAPAGAVVGALTAWAVASGVFAGWTWRALWPLGPRDVQAYATAEDPGTAVRDFVLVAIGAVSLGAVVLMLFHGKETSAPTFVLGMLSIAGSWVVLHTVYALRYARLYYATPVGGLDFQQDAEPTYRDFAYLAFTVGMTFQVSDTDIRQPALRTTVLRHALVSFGYNTIVVAVTINAVAGLARQ